MRKYVEPLGGLLPLGSAALERLSKMKCPAAIVSARAMVAKTEAVKALRPQALHVKIVTVGVFAAMFNAPFGALREHTDKFSPAWFAAVHTPIPFIAILRKAVVMPKFAMLFTFTAAIVGQALGARMERQRMLRQNLPAPPVLQSGLSCGMVAPSLSQAVSWSDAEDPCCKRLGLGPAFLHGWHYQECADLAVS